MASICKECDLQASADDVWAAVRDWRALHTRLAPGFVTDTTVDGRDRVVTFFNGAVARERIIDVDDEHCRLAWSIIGGPYTHHNGAAQVFATGDGTARLVWTADLLPDESAVVTDEMMERGMDAIRARFAVRSRAASQG